MNKIGFSQRSMECITSSAFSVLWNGEVAGDFHPTRGIRQEDPLSPYVFVLCMEKLSHMIADSVLDKAWTPIKAGRNGPEISHLIFADVRQSLDVCMGSMESTMHVNYERLQQSYPSLDPYGEIELMWCGISSLWICRFGLKKTFLLLLPLWILSCGTVSSLWLAIAFGIGETKRSSTLLLGVPTPHYQIQHIYYGGGASD